MEKSSLRLSADPWFRFHRTIPHPVKFVSCIWKRIDGFIIDFLKEEMKNIKASHDNVRV